MRYPRHVCNSGNSMNEGAHGCAGKGWVGSFRSLERMLEHHIAHGLHPSKSCLWGAPDAEDRSGCRYNEVVLNGDAYAQRLPRVIEAFFFPENGPVHHREGEERQARILHRRFAIRYALSGSEAPPLLAFDVQLARNRRAPFRVVVT